jgi:hypothetical protein
MDQPDPSEGDRRDDEKMEQHAAGEMNSETASGLNQSATTDDDRQTTTTTQNSTECNENTSPENSTTTVGATPGAEYNVDGKKAYLAGDFAGAVDHWERTLKSIGYIRSKEVYNDKAHKAKLREFLRLELGVHLNLAQGCLKLNQYIECLLTCYYKQYQIS